MEIWGFNPADEDDKEESSGDHTRVEPTGENESGDTGKDIEMLEL
jgi:hypothetical protein